MVVRFRFIAGLLGFAALTAVAQTPAPSNPSAIGFSTGIISGNFVTNGVQSLKGIPYSAEETSERVQTLADGTHITQTTQKGMIYRDSEGRTRNEHTPVLPPQVKMAAAPTFITILDPVAGYRYTLNSQDHIARRARWPRAIQSGRVTGASGRLGTLTLAPPPPPPPPPPQSANFGSFSAEVAGPNAPSDPSRPTTTREPLGTQSIEGVTAEGMRRTTIYPEGSMGNDRPITTVFETWTSPELKITLLSRMSDPRSGESTTKLTNISRADPDPALFEVPSDYTIEDEPQPVGRSAQ